MKKNYIDILINLILYLKPTKVHVHAQIQWIHISIYENYEIVNKQSQESR